MLRINIINHSITFTNENVHQIRLRHNEQWAALVQLLSAIDLSIDLDSITFYDHRILSSMKFNKPKDPKLLSLKPFHSISPSFTLYFSLSLSPCLAPTLHCIRNYTRFYYYLLYSTAWQSQQHGTLWTQKVKTMINIHLDQLLFVKVACTLNSLFPSLSVGLCFCFHFFLFYIYLFFSVCTVSLQFLRVETKNNKRFWTSSSQLQFIIRGFFGGALYGGTLIST